MKALVVCGSKMWKCWSAVRWIRNDCLSLSAQCWCYVLAAASHPLTPLTLPRKGELTPCVLLDQYSTVKTKTVTASVSLVCCHTSFYLVYSSPHSRPEMVMMGIIGQIGDIVSSFSSSLSVVFFLNFSGLSFWVESNVMVLNMFR